MALENLTDEQLQELIGKLAKPEEKKPEEQKMQYRLPSGEVITGTMQEINQRLTQELQKQQQPEPTPQANGVQVVDKVNWSFDEFQKKFMDDPSQGLSYMYKAKHGFDPVTAMPALAQIVGGLVGKLNQIEQENFFSKHEGVKKTDNNQKVLYGLMQSGRAQTLDDAFAIAKAQNLLEVEEVKQPNQFQVGTEKAPTFFDPTNPNNFGPPPQIGGNSGLDSGPVSTFQLEQQLQNVDQNQLRGFIEDMEQRVRFGR